MTKKYNPNKPFTLDGLLNCLKQAKENAGDNDANIEVWVDNKMYRIIRVGQFGVTPTTTLTLGKCEMEL